MEHLSVGDGDLNLDSGLDGDGGDLLDDLRGGVQVDHPLVDPHLEPVPGLGSLSAGRLPRGDPQGLGRHPHGAFGLQVLLLRTLDQVGADLLQGLDVAGRQGDADPVDRGLVAAGGLRVLVGRLEDKFTALM